jgi:hypothetical protein
LLYTVKEMFSILSNICVIFFFDYYKYGKHTVRKINFFGCDADTSSQKIVVQS